jgi:hypothetical protein
MVYVGQFNEKQICNREDKVLVEQKMKETGLKYTKSQIVTKGRKPVGLKIWLLTNEEYFNSNQV